MSDETSCPWQTGNRIRRDQLRRAYFQSKNAGHKKISEFATTKNQELADNLCRRFENNQPYFIAQAKCMEAKEQNGGGGRCNSRSGIKAVLEGRDDRPYTPQPNTPHSPKTPTPKRRQRRRPREKPNEETLWESL